MVAFPKHLCTFCGKRLDQVRCLIAGPNHQFICDECVTLCVEIVRENPRQDDIIGRLNVWRQFMTFRPAADAMGGVE